VCIGERERESEREGGRGEGGHVTAIKSIADDKDSTGCNETIYTTSDISIK
jgi:hypothetical protein